MSALQNLGAVAGGIMGGMSMKQALDQQKLQEERLREEMNWRRQDREVANHARETNAAFYSKLGAQPFMQAQSPGSDAVMVPTDPNAPDEPTMGVDRAAQTPRAEIAKIGMSEVMKPKPADFDAAAKQDAATLNQFKMQAYALQGQDRANALAALNEKKAELLSNYLQQHAGDPMSDPAGYAKKAGQIGAYFGEVPTGLQAMQLAAVMRKHQQEGAEDALKLANAGDKAGALKVWNENGDHRFKDLELVPAMSALGTPSYQVTGITPDGKRIEVLPQGMTALDAMISLQSGVETAKLAMQKVKMDAESANLTADNARQDKQLSITDRHYRNQDAAAMEQARKAAKSSTPAQVQTAEWLVENKDNKAAMDAWALVKTLGEKSRDEAIRETATTLMSPNGGFMNSTDAVKKATELVDSVRGTPQVKQSGGGYDAYLKAYNKAKAAGNKADMEALTQGARAQGIVK